jgi:hypothetical protein
VRFRCDRRTIKVKINTYGKAAALVKWEDVGRVGVYYESMKRKLI